MNRYLHAICNWVGDGPSDILDIVADGLCGGFEFQDTYEPSLTSNLHAEPSPPTALNRAIQDLQRLNFFKAVETFEQRNVLNRQDSGFTINSDASWKTLLQKS